MGNGFNALDRLAEAVEDPTPILKKIGGLGKQSSIDAFENQEFAGVKWPRYYPNQPAPSFNIAGILTDLAGGQKEPSDRDINPRPVLVKSGALKTTLAMEVNSQDASVRWGTPLDYGQIHQDGGKSTIPVTPQAKEKLKNWLFTKSGKVRKGKERAAKVLGKYTKDKVNQYTVNVARRPFVGITKQMGEDIKEMLKRHFEEAQDGRS